MSTKCTIIHSNKDNWHFYFDYKDMNHHLTVKGKEVELPKSFKDMVKKAVTIHTMQAHFEKDIAKFGTMCWDDKELKE